MGDVQCAGEPNDDNEDHSHRVSVLVVDDCTLYREGLAASIADEAVVTDVYTAWDLGSMRAVLECGGPTVILLNLASIDSRALLRMACENSPNSRLIVLGVSEDDEDGIIACAEQGVAGYHLRSESLRELLELIRSVAVGETLCSPRIAALLLRRLSTLAGQRGPETKLLALTVREDQILRLIEMGMSNRQIAERLHIEVHTVKNHVHSVLAKLGVRRRGEAAAAFRTHKGACTG